MPTFNATPGAREGNDLSEGCSVSQQLGAAALRVLGTGSRRRAARPRPLTCVRCLAQGGNLSSWEGGAKALGCPWAWRCLPVLETTPGACGWYVPVCVGSVQPDCDCAGRGLPVSCTFPGSTLSSSLQGPDSTQRGQRLGLGSQFLYVLAVRPRVSHFISSSLGFSSTKDGDTETPLPGRIEIPCCP